MSDRDDDKTIGEVFRRLVDMDERYEKKLDRIEDQVRLTNGRTTRLETQVTWLNREVRDLKHSRPTPSSMPAVVIPEGESFSVKISPKMWALIATAFTGLSIFGPLLKDWLERLFGGR